MFTKTFAYGRKATNWNKSITKQNVEKREKNIYFSQKNILCRMCIKGDMEQRFSDAKYGEEKAEC